MEAISITAFDGGRNTRYNQLVIQDNQCASASRNVWAPSGVLEQAPGYNEYLSMTSTANNCRRIQYENSAGKDYVICIVQSAAADGGAYPWNVAGAVAVPMGYVTGTVSISGASLISATGSGTLWSAHVLANDKFRIDASSSAWRIINSVEDNTHLTLQTAVPVAVATGSAYTILKQITSPTDVSIASLGGYTVIFDGVSTPQAVTAGNSISVSGGPAAQYAVAHKRYIFTLRTASTDSRLQWSALNDGLTWPTTNFEDIDKSRGRGAGLISYGNELIVFKTLSMYRVLGEVFDPSNPTYSIMPIAVPRGFVFNSGWTPVIHNGLLFFLTREGLYYYRSYAPRIEKVSDLYDVDFTNGNPFGDANLVTATESRNRAVSFKNNLLIFYVGNNSTFGASSSLLGILDKRGAYWQNGLNAAGTQTFISDSTVYPDPTGKPRLLCIDRSAARVLDLTIEPPTYTTTYVIPTTGNTTSIDALWVSKEFNIGFGTIKYAVIYLEKQSTGTLTFSYSIDQGSLVSTSVDMTVGRGNVLRRVININQKGSTFQLRIGHNTSGETFKVYRLDIMYEPDPQARIQ